MWYTSLERGPRRTGAATPPGRRGRESRRTPCSQIASPSHPTWQRWATRSILAGLLALGSTGIAVAQAGPDSVIPELVPKAELSLAPESEVNTSYAPNVPPPSGRTEPAIVEVRFEVVENVKVIDPATGAAYETWGYRVEGDDEVISGTPGPMIRARVGDVLRFTLTNPAGNAMPHNVDLHAVTGTGGGAADTTVPPGMTRTIEARLLYPGFFMYHCAFGDVPEHISRGMYGGILVDPAEPLPPVGARALRRPVGALHDAWRGRGRPHGHRPDGGHERAAHVRRLQRRQGRAHGRERAAHQGRRAAAHLLHQRWPEPRSPASTPSARTGTRSIPRPCS